MPPPDPPIWLLPRPAQSGVGQTPVGAQGGGDLRGPLVGPAVSAQLPRHGGSRSSARPLDPAPAGSGQWRLGGRGQTRGTHLPGKAEWRLLSRVVAPRRFHLLEGGGRIRLVVRSPAVWVARVVLGFSPDRWPRRRGEAGTFAPAGRVLKCLRRSGDPESRQRVTRWPRLGKLSVAPGSETRPQSRLQGLRGCQPESGAPSSASSSQAQFSATAAPSWPPGSFPAVPLCTLLGASPSPTSAQLLLAAHPPAYARPAPQVGRPLCSRGCGVTASCRCTPCGRRC